MPRIRVLPEVLASQVAAGEVVERPASAVKELVENSLDAGAGEVLVEVRKGGAALLRVTDDGHGMGRDDALLCLERHATSKLATAKDLGEIRTLGFRGEAVPSIASVSRFRLTTRTADEVVGTEVAVEGGVVRAVKDAGCAPGTVVEVRDLFFNVPARRKFLRAETTEAAHIDHQLRLHALASPGVRFRFRKDEREVFDLPAGMSPLDRVRWMLGTQLGAELVELPLTHGNGLSVHGFVLPARHARRGRRHQCVFMNARPVEDAAISRGLWEGFRGEVGEGLHPAVWLWIEIEPRLVDVNVHPAKREIRLHRPHELREAVAEAVRSGLAGAGHHRPVVGLPLRPVAAESPAEGTVSAVPPEWRAPQPQAIDLPLGEPEAERKQAGSGGFDFRLRMPVFRKIGELLGRFAVLESEDGLVLLDPRAARERILYERWLAASRGAAVESQSLLVPALMELGPREAELLLRHRMTLADAGFDLEEFGSGTIRLGAVPAFFQHGDAVKLLVEVADELLDGAAATAVFSLEKLAKALARRAALQERCRPEEAGPLLDQLFRCDLPYCAADGRPTLLEFSLAELERRFGG